MKKYFKEVTIRLFYNSIHFNTIGQVMEYYTASPLFKESYSSDEERSGILEAMRKKMEAIIAAKGEYIIKKEVYGMVGMDEC